MSSFNYMYGEGCVHVQAVVPRYTQHQIKYMYLPLCSEHYHYYLS
jgi:hypothetical protein